MSKCVMDPELQRFVTRLSAKLARISPRYQSREDAEQDIWRGLFEKDNLLMRPGQPWINCAKSTVYSVYGNLLTKHVRHYNRPEKEVRLVEEEEAALDASELIDARLTIHNIRKALKLRAEQTRSYSFGIDRYTRTVEYIDFAMETGGSFQDYAEQAGVTRQLVFTAYKRAVAEILHDGKR